MRTALFLMLILFCGSLVAQKTPFLRIYDSHGKKIYKGKVYIITDSSLSLIGKKEALNVPIKDIGYIKTKHTDGNNVLIGSIVGGLSGAILGAASATPSDNPSNEIIVFTPAEGAATGALLGMVAGAAIGGITIAFKNSETFHIDGDVIKWKQFVSVYEKK
jgi:hypothetical protein